jgi:regulator of protease activity HflC (stomatin/prohibitin superfamily)
MSEQQHPSEPESTPKPPEQSPIVPPRSIFRRLTHAVRRGIHETLHSRGGRRTIGVGLIVLASAGVGGGIVWLKPVSGVEPGEVAFRTNRLTGRIDEVHEGWVLDIPGVHRIRRYSLREQVYRPGGTPFQSVEGLTVGVAFTVRYAFEMDHLRANFRTLPEDMGQNLVEPTADGVLHRVLATRTVKEIFSSPPGLIQKQVEDELRPLLAADGVILRGVFMGNVDLPDEYRKGLESMLTEELAVEKMHATLDLKEKEIKQAELDGEADKVRREKAAEASGSEQIIAAKAQEEAMRHILPFKRVSQKHPSTDRPDVGDAGTRKVARPGILREGAFRG